jgi:hypothetical protein
MVTEPCAEEVMNGSSNRWGNGVARARRRTLPCPARRAADTEPLEGFRPKKSRKYARATRSLYRSRGRSVPRLDRRHRIDSDGAAVSVVDRCVAWLAPVTPSSTSRTADGVSGGF